MTGMFDAEGLYGGPVFSTVALQKAVPSSPTDGWGVFSDKWVTYPELLTDAGVSWKSYDSPDGDDEDNPLPLFKQYWPQNYTGDPVNTARAAQLRANMSLTTRPSCVSWKRASTCRSRTSPTGAVRPSAT